MLFIRAWTALWALASGEPFRRLRRGGIRLLWPFALAAAAALELAPGAAAQRFTFRQYDAADGLADMSIHDLLQDRAGYIWAGTDNGLYRYDGTRFVGFHNEDGLPDNTVRGIAEAPDGAIWTATRDGVARFNGKRFETVEVGEKGIFRRIVFDAAGRIYLQGQTGIERGDPDGPGHYRFSTAARGRTAGLWVDGEDLWFCRDKDLWRLSGGTEQRMGSPAGLPAEVYSAAVKDISGNWWVLSGQHLYELPQGQGRFVDRSAGLPRLSLVNLYTDRHGRIFVSSDTGVTVLDGDRLVSIDAQHGLPADGVKPVLLDREGSLWLGSEGSGLIRQLGREQWLSWKKEDGLLHNAVWSIHEDRTGQVWLGSNGGLNVLDAAKTGKIVRSWNSHSGLAGDEVYAIAESPRGEIYASQYPAGISRFSEAGKLLKTYKSPSVLVTGWVMAMAVDAEGRLWTAGTAGLFHTQKPVDDGEPVFQRADVPGTVPGTIFFDVRADGGTVWAGSAIGLARYAGGQWRVYGARDGLKSERVGVVAPGPGGLWIAYDNALGLTRVQFAGDRMLAEDFTRADGLASDKIYALAYDAGGRLWVTSDAGVDVLEAQEAAGPRPGAVHWRHYGTQDGLIWNDTNSYAIYPGRDGSIWIGTSGGLSRYSPPRYPVPEVRPAVAITSIRTSGKGASQRWEPNDRPELPYGSRSLALQFTALSYVAPESIRFRYRLLGNETAWTETRERSLRFEGLPAGRYTFEVAAAGPDGVWAPGSAFAFSIQPAWWQTWWFLTLAGAAGVVLILAVWKLRVGVLMRNQERLETLVAERTAELSASHAQLEEIAYRDMLTMLPNRRSFTHQFRDRLEAAMGDGERFALLLIDLDRFKQINDTFGHDAGDAVLVETARRLRSAVRDSDCVARLGGDEFAVLLFADYEQVAIEQVCQRIVGDSAVGIPFDGSMLNVGASVGIAMYPEDGETETSLYKAADVALYEAKQTRSSFCFRPRSKPAQGVFGGFGAHLGASGQPGQPGRSGQNASV